MPDETWSPRNSESPKLVSGIRQKNLKKPNPRISETPPKLRNISGIYLLIIYICFGSNIISLVLGNVCW